MSDVLTELVSKYGYLVVGLFLFLEGAGIPVPGETALVTAAAFAGRGTLSLVGVILSGAFGTVAGSSAGFWIGLRGGTALVMRHGKWLGATPERMDKAHAFFSRHGTKAVLIGRFIAFLRSFIGIFAGVSRMSLRAFMTYNVIGGVLWVGVFCGLGFAFGKNLPRLIHYLGRVSLLFAIVVALGAAIILGWRWLAENRLQLARDIDRRWERLAETPHPKHPKLWLFFTGHAARREYLALHLAIGFVVSIATIGVFGAITEDVVETSPLTRFDDSIASRLNRLLAPATLRALSLFSALGSRSAMTAVFVVGAIVLAFRRLGLALAAWCAAFVGGALLDRALRVVIRRSALPFAEQVLAEWSTGIVSGHLLGVIVGYGMVAYLLVGLTRRVRTRATIVTTCVLFISAIAIARLYLGVHYVSDEFAGLAAGLIWLMTCVSGLEIARSL